MSWLERLRSRGGALVEPAERLLRDGPGLLGSDFGGGAAGIVALARRLEAHGEDEAEDEAYLVESAGALLGLILIDHLGRARHTARDGHHRLQLGNHGFFDPFRAVESALEAEDVRGHLAREVARAEAEAHDRGPLSAFVLAFATCLAERRPDLQITEQFETRLRLSDGSEVDVARSVRATVGEPDRSRHAAAAKLVGMLPRHGGTPPLEFAQVQARLLPRLCRQDAFADLDAHGRGSVHRRPWRGPLAVALVVEEEGRCRYARDDEVARWRAQGAAPHACALENLAARSDRARFARLETEHGPLVIGKSGDGLDSARALLPGLFEVLARELGARMRIALPHRDLLLACSSEKPSLVAAMRQRAGRDFARAPHPLLDTTLRLDSQGVHADAQPPLRG